MSEGNRLSAIGFRLKTNGNSSRGLTLILEIHADFLGRLEFLPQTCL